MKLIYYIAAFFLATTYPQSTYSQNHALFVNRNVLGNSKRVTRQTSSDQMVQNILEWLQGVYTKNSRKIRQGSLREYLPPTNTQKPRPFQPVTHNTIPSINGDNGDDNNIISGGYPPSGSINPQPPFNGGGTYPGISPPAFTGYPQPSSPQPPFPPTTESSYSSPGTGYPGPSYPGPSTSYPNPSTYPSFPSPNTNYPSTGYPGPSTGYPGPSTGYPGPSTGYPGPGTDYPGPGTGYPGPGTGYPGSNTDYPGSSTGNPNPSTGFPGTSTGYPNTNYPGPSTNYPGPSTDFPGPSTGYPGPSTGYPGPSTGYPGPSTGYPGPSTGYPGPSTGYPNPTTGYPSPSTSYPTGPPTSPPYTQSPTQPPETDTPFTNTPPSPNLNTGDIFISTTPVDNKPTEGGNPTTVSPPDDDLKHPPHIHAIDVECSKDMMTIHIEFNRQFNGIIYSKGHYNTPECRYVQENSDQTKYTFTVSLNSCGTEFINAFDTQGKSYLENVLVLQNEAGIQEVWDTIRSVRCLWEGNLKKALNVALSVGMLNQEIVTFSGDTAMAKLDIQLGKGPFAPPANGLVKIGEIMTLVVSITGDPGFDIQVKDCRAKDSTGENVVALTDEQGCILKPKLFGAFQKTRSTGDTGASIIAYAFFSAFKFPDVMDLSLECNVDLCKTDCAICPEPNQKIDPGRRRRRDLYSLNATTYENDNSVTMKKMLRVIVPEDIDDVNAFINISHNDGICMSTEGFVLSSSLLISILIASCLFSTYTWLKYQRIGYKK